MNPVSNPVPPEPSKPMTDVVPPPVPASAPPPPSPAPPAADTVQAEIVSSVPVHQPTAAVPAAPSVPNPYNPISGTHSPPAEPAATRGDDNELSNILKDVNNEVKVKLEPGKKSRGPGILAKSLANMRKPKSTVPQPKKSGLNMVIIVTTAVVAALIILAVYAFGQNQNNTALSHAHLAAVAEAKKVQAQNTPLAFGITYLDSFSSSLQAEAASVASSQDFDSAPLSDSALGL